MRTGRASPPMGTRTIHSRNYRNGPRHLQPAAGAHGELTALLMISRYFSDRGERRNIVIVPDSAHGTNPASAALCGYQVVEVKSDARGNIDLNALRTALSPNVAALMLT